MRQKKSQIAKIINDYKLVLISLGIRTQRIILFGSHAHNQQHNDSDIDLVVVSNDFQKMNLRQRLEILGIAAIRIMQPIEAKGYTPAELKKAAPTNFIGEVLATGLVF